METRYRKNPAQFSLLGNPVISLPPPQFPLSAAGQSVSTLTTLKLLTENDI